MTSEGSKQARHFGIAMNALVFTNLAPEHIESHGSYEKYRAAKLAFARALARSPKPNKVFIGNGDDSEIENFLRAVGNSAKKIIFKLKDWDNLARLSGGGLPQLINLPLPGTFNKYNALAAIKLAEHLKIKFPIIKQALENFNEIKGRVQRIYASTKGLRAKQNFEVIVDYAHTPDSLKQLLETFKDSRKICVFGSTGGGRDVWKRKVLGEILDQHCAEAIISTDDPYDEDPQQIANMVATGFTTHRPEIILDRREAIAAALAKATVGSTVLLIGKGTDPFIMGPKGTKTPWSDAVVAQEEIDKLLSI
jgi:UDP-N-acetylmuramoyl-L-alanyl-D-glutamate--2,6-diaminopimelate ligase